MKVVKLVLKTLIERNIISKNSFKKNSIYIMHYQEPELKVAEYWSSNLDLPIEIFKCVNTEEKTKEFGIAHVYLSDTILRRVIDLLIEILM